MRCPVCTWQLPLKTAQFYAISRECEGVQAIKEQQLVKTATTAKSALQCRHLLQAGAEPA
jgi:hypothetical protein